MQNAAVAGLYGWDPMRLLAMAEDDFVLASIVLNETHRIAGERQVELLDHVANKTSSQVVAGVGRIVRGALKALRPRKP